MSSEFVYRPILLFCQNKYAENYAGAGRTLPCPALPCPALPCPALPCPALPCPALPCPALPCPAARSREFWSVTVASFSLTVAAERRQESTEAPY